MASIKSEKDSDGNPMGPTPQKKNKNKRQIVLLIIVVALIIFRLALPYIVLDYVNKKLADLGDYYGHVEDIDIHLYRGAYVLKDLRLVKIGMDTKPDTIPFFESPKIDLSVQWKAIFNGRIVGEIYVESPVLNFVKGKHKDEDIKQDSAEFKQLVKDLMPLKVNHFDVNNGQIHYIDLHAKPKVDAFISEIRISAENLSNVNDQSELLPAKVVATGNVYEGTMLVNVDFDALNEYPTFDMNAEFTDINLVLLNDVLRAYGNFDVKTGTIGLFTEFAAKDGEFGGYVKPYVTDLDVVQWNKEEGNVMQILWETLVGSVLEIFQNQPEEQLSTKVPIKGKFNDPNVNIWKAITYVLRNAFVEAFRPVVDHSISIGNLEEEKDKSFLERIFGSKEEKKK